MNCFNWFQLPAIPSSKHDENRKLGLNTVHKQPLFIKGLFSVAQSLFAHMGVGQTHRHMIFAKPISGNQACPHVPGLKR